MKQKKKPQPVQKKKEASIIRRGSKAGRRPAASHSLLSQKQNFCSPADIKKFLQETKSTRYLEVENPRKAARFALAEQEMYHSQRPAVR